MKTARPSIKTFLRPYLSLNRPAGTSNAPKNRAYAFSTQDDEAAQVAGFGAFVDRRGVGEKPGARWCLRASRRRRSGLRSLPPARNPATLSGLRASRIVSGRPRGSVAERCREW